MPSSKRTLAIMVAVQFNSAMGFSVIFPFLPLYVNPKMVVMVEDLADVRTLLSEARALRTPVTFRAAGTSLSGQAVTDSVLAVLGPSWRAHSILGSGSLLRLQPGVIGAHANATLAPYGRKIGPDPASINAATIGGIAANNASGMCCGTSQNSYRTLAAMTVLLADGSMLDTSSEDTRRAFTRSRPDLIRDIRLLAERVRANPMPRVILQPLRLLRPPR